MDTKTTYDYIILGGGAAGLSLAHRMAEDAFFQDKKIALIEKSDKNKNDRTWCFWSNKEEKYDSILYQSWKKLHFYAPDLDKALDVGDYQYKMIRGIDFYNHILESIRKASNIDLIKEEIVSIEEGKEETTVKTKEGQYVSSVIFKSYPSSGKISPEKHIYVDQHFKGYVIETSYDAFDDEKATFMDFRIEQAGETRFLYVLPFSKRRALVEVAIFSNSILQQGDYDKILRDYISTYLEIEEYKVEEEEFGIIPMTTYPYWKHNTEMIYHIGTGGGAVKSSSGYAFQRIQEHSDAIVSALKEGKPVSTTYENWQGKYLKYDKTMLHAILSGKTTGTAVFSSLFQKKKAYEIFKFLDQETSILEELSIFTAPPFWPFLTSFLVTK